jgi:hypothetical protein
MRAINPFNPFAQIAGLKSLVLGFLGLFFTTFLAFKTGTHFYGMLNIDYAKDSDYWVFLTENVSSWILLSFFLYLSGIILSKSRIRAIDILGTTLLSRIPLIIAPLIRTMPLFQSFEFQSWEMYFVKGVYLISLIWTIVLLFNAYKISCNLKNERLVVSFIVSLIISETCTEIFIKSFI